MERLRVLILGWRQLPLPLLSQRVVAATEVAASAARTAAGGLCGCGWRRERPLLRRLVLGAAISAVPAAVAPVVGS